MSGAMSNLPRRRLLASALALLLATPLAGCGGERESAPGTETGNPPAASAPAEQPARVVELSLGTAVGGDNRVTSPTTSFRPSDTIHAAVTTEGGGGTLEARWTFEDGQEVETQTRNVASGRQTTEFHVSNPDGWPAGEYEVEILVDGNPAESRTFTVG